MKEQENQQTEAIYGQKRKEEVICITGGKSEVLGLHQETTEKSRKQQHWFCIKLYIIFVPN